MAAQRRIDSPGEAKASTRWECRRIVSMAPSITETLYALDLGDRVVGVERDCRYPPEVERVKKTGNVGGYFDPNIEAIVRLKPDLVIMLEEQARTLPNFNRLNLETLVVSHRSIDGVIESFRTIGRVCGRGLEGRQTADEFQNRIDRIREQVKGDRPRVLFVLDRTFGTGRPTDLYVAGDDDFINAILALAGGQNAYCRRGVRYPVVSTEGVLRLNPDVIVELAPAIAIERHGHQKILDDWKSLPSVEAVRNSRIVVLDDDYAMVPGPRMLRLVEDLAQQLHPEVRWNEGDRSPLSDDADGD
jgi:iron complex transport system substrate-binding protein